MARGTQGSIRVAGARIDFYADDREYQRVVGRVLGRQGALRRSHARVADSARAAAIANRNLVASLAGVGSLALGVREITQAVDAYTLFQNRIRETTSVLRGYAISQREVIAIQGEAARVANETRASLRGTVEIYSRLAQSSESLDLTTDQILGIVRTLNQATILGGATAQEARAGLIQLSQGFASDRLGGEELRAVTEQLPVVARLIAKEMGVTIGQMRELSKQGAITGRVVASALLNAADDIEERFERTTVTIDQAITVLANNVLKLFGEAGSSSGGAGLISGSILAVANNLDLIAGAALSAAAVFGGRYASSLARAAAAARANRIETVATAKAAEKATATTLHQARVQEQTARFALLAANDTRALVGTNTRAEREYAAAKARTASVARQAAELDKAAAISGAGVLGTVQRRVAVEHALAKSQEEAAKRSVDNERAQRAQVATVAQLQAKERDYQRAKAATVKAEREHMLVQRQLVRQTTLVGRATRLASGALAALGGPVGAITTGLLLGATAWSIWGRSAQDAVQSAGEIGDEMISRLLGAVSPLDEMGKQMEVIRTRMKDILQEIDDLLSPGAVQLAPVFGSISTQQNRALPDLPGREIDKLRAEYVRLEDQLERINQLMDLRSGQQAAEATAEAYRKVSLSLDDPVRKARDLVRAIEDQAREGIRAAQLRRSLAGVDEETSEKALAFAEARQRVSAAILKAERELADARQDSARADSIAQRAKDAALLADASSKERKEADRIAVQAQRQSEAKRQQVALYEAQLGHLREISGYEEIILRSIEAQARAQAAVESARILEPVGTPRVDYQALRAESREFLADQQERIAGMRRELALAERIAQAPERDRTRLLAQGQAYNEFLAEEDRLLRSLERANSDLARAQNDWTQARNALISAGDNSTRAQREEAESAREAYRTSKELVSTLRAQALVFRANAEEAGAAASAIGQLAAAQASVGQISGRMSAAIEFAQAGVRKFEDALVSFATTGKLSVGDMAKSVIADLTRILVRATITSNALRALGISGSGALTGGGLFSFLGGLFGGGGAAATAPVYGAQSAEQIVRDKAGGGRVTRQGPSQGMGQVGGGGVRIEIVNPPGLPLEVNTADVRSSLEGMVARITMAQISADARSRGPMTQQLAAAAAS